ncbi:MAG: type IV pili methyl-accepting chemotaxis transducer N-terminal domain-containing protein [Pseudomonadales bacterium]|nr:type IV pili methyl-accepting chemotaxis transducer N-terminal domain-containing protein [Pseudomonadales bacterium]MCP5213462.1 type IV pili methyl-accepting chemotaxis transducer N-terminal domain-containing protein [Pseudomonadales bacterium]
MKVSNVNTGAGSNRLILGLMVLLVFAIAGFITILVITSTEGGFDKQYIRHAGELRVLSQEIAKNANEAASGKAEAFAGLAKATEEFERRWGYLKQGDPSEGMPSSPVQVKSDMGSVQAVWEQVQVDAKQILASKESVLALHQVAEALSETVPQLQTEYDDAIAILLENNTSASQIAIAQRQSWLAERIVRNVNIILRGGENAVLAADAFELDATEFSRVYEGMLKGDPTLNVERVRNTKVLKIFENISGQFQVVRDSVDRIIESSPELFQVREAANTISSNSKELLNKTSALAERFQVLPNERTVSPLMGYACGILALAIIGLLGVIIYRDTRKRLNEQSETNERNQTAILRLLDEIADLADGDLTISATVTEDFTGAIADSINYAIDQLRSLVVSINENSKMVSSAAQKTRATAQHLSETSANQARDITAATGSINQIASSMDAVSGSADESSKVAERSVVIANKGASAVQNTINGMDKIREQIQKTSKQIKRLGESSQEIGDIISLIDDIADQTNILSLNAAIQASMAGEAGRGFAVVADEVQRLAERSGAATKQIEVLVKTIQADTNDAVISMEQTTAEVVQGARLAQDAGVALGEIEEVSNDLAKLIQEISGAAKQQSTAANQISKSMNVIQEITSQTSSGTLATASSIGHMADMAKEMLDSVAGFKLPNSEATEQHEEHEPRGQSRVQDSSSAVTKEVAETQMASKDESTQNDDLEIDPKLGELAEMDVDEAVTIDDGLLANDETMETSDQEGRNASAA